MWRWLGASSDLNSPDPHYLVGSSVNRLPYFVVEYTKHVTCNTDQGHLIERSMAIPIESSPPPGWDREGIDDLLGLFPPGRLSEIVGPRSSGGSSLLLALVARIT